MDTDISVDLNDMTLGELEEFEDIAGIPASSLANGQIPAKGITALVYISGKRADPAFTIEQARQVKLSAVKFPDAVDAADPTSLHAVDSAAG